MVIPTNGYKPALRSPNDDLTAMERQDLLAAKAATEAAIARGIPATAGSAGQYPAVGSSGPIWRSEAWFDVSHPRFGASTASADNLAAINTATAAANSAGGGTVYVPGGTWLVKPVAATGWIILYDNVRLLLAPNAVLKVSDTTGNFQTLIGAVSELARVENVTIEGGRIDLNPSGNTTATVGNVSGQVQNAVRFRNFDDVTVKGVTFDRCCGQNTVILSGDGCTNAKVLSNTFRFTRRGAGTTYDNSAIYVEAIGQEICGNRGEADIAEAAYGFIETHNGQSVVSGNRSDGFRTGCNIVAGSYADALLDSNDITVETNSFANTQRAIVLWPSTNGLRNITVRGNPISVAQVSHNTTTCVGVGTHTSAGSTGEIINLVVEGNPIIFEADTRTTASGSALSGYYMGGILIGGPGNMSNITVRGNPITRSPSIGIRVGDSGFATTVSTAEIAGNPLTDCGYNSNITAAYRIPVFLDGSLSSVHAYRNPITDTGSPSAYAGNSVRANFTLGTVANTFLHGNPVTAASALAASIDRSKVGDYTASATLDFPSIASGGSQTLTVTVLGAATTDVAYASPTTVLAAGLVVKQVWVSAANTVSIAVHNATAAAIDPASATWRVGIQKRTA